MDDTPENLAWRRSSYCSDHACAEAAFAVGKVYLRNSERPKDLVVFTASEWEAFKKGVEYGEF